MDINVDELRQALADLSSGKFAEGNRVLAEHGDSARHYIVADVLMCLAIAISRATPGTEYYMKKARDNGKK